MLSRRLTHYALLTAVMALLTMPGLGSHSFWDVDEGVNAEAAREMRETGTILTPLFNFELRTAKPVMLYWLQLTSYSLFGVSEWAARLPSVLAGLVTLLLIYELARAMFGTAAGLIASLVLATEFEFCLLSHAATPDSTLLVFTVLTYFSFWMGSRNGGRSWFFPCGAAAGLAMLTKGPVGLVMPGTVIFLYFLWNRELSRLWDRRVIWGFLIFVLVAAPWYILVTVETRGVWLKQFIGRENLTRFSQPMENHSGPIFYHVIVILFLIMPWSGVLVGTVANLVRELRRRGQETGGNELTEERRAVRLLIAWVVTYLVFFSAAATKLPNYALPVYPALAILMARLLDSWRRQSPAVMRWVMPLSVLSLVTTGLVFSAGVVVASGKVPLGIKMPAFPTLLPYATIGVVPLVGAVFGWIYLRRGQRDRLVGSMIATAIVFVGLLAALPIAALDEYKAPRPLVAQAGIDQPDRDIRLVCLQWFQPSVVYYSKREVTRAVNWPEASASLEMKHPVYLFVPDKVWKQIVKEDPRAGNYREVARHFDIYSNGEVLVVTNQ